MSSAREKANDCAVGPDWRDAGHWQGANRFSTFYDFPGAWKIGAIAVSS
jgi:hypothetical protein